MGEMTQEHIESMVLEEMRLTRYFIRRKGNLPSYTIGIVDLSGTTEIEQGVNDTFIMDVDGVEKQIVLQPGTYNSTTLLSEINSQLTAVNANVTASYFDRRLKLSSNEVG